MKLHVELCEHHVLIEAIDTHTGINLIEIEQPERAIQLGRDLIAAGLLARMRRVAAERTEVSTS